MRVKNKRILITGAAKRIGRILSLLIAREGADLVFHHNNSIAEAKSLQKDNQELGHTAVIFQADLSDPRSTSDFIDQVFDSYEIDAVINNASIFSNLNWATTRIEDWRKHHSVNLETPFLISQAYAKSLKEGNKGKIINKNRRRAQPFAYINQTNLANVRLN